MSGVAYLLEGNWLHAMNNEPNVMMSYKPPSAK